MPEDKDDLFASLCVQQGYLTPEQLDDARAAQRVAFDLGMEMSLADVLVSKKVLARAQCDEVMRVVRIQTGEARVVGNYEVVSKIGEGGMGVVYKARSLESGEVVALKVLPPSMARNSELLARFRREAEMTRSLAHDNIVRCVEFGLDRDRKLYYCALEYVEGEDLATILERGGRLAEDRALDIARKVAQALEYSASHGLIHRDVKPQNIMVTTSGTVKLLDLGLARSVEAEDTRLTQSGMFVGSPHYASPEQAYGEREIDTRSDIYSLGATLYHMLTGEKPFPGETPAAVLTKVVSERLTWPGDVNPRISEGACMVLEKMMAREADFRYQSPAELLNDLDVLAAGGSIVQEALPRRVLPFRSPGRAAARRAYTTGPHSRVQTRTGMPASRAFSMAVLALVLTVAGVGLFVFWPRGEGGGTVERVQPLSPAVPSAAPAAGIDAERAKAEEARKMLEFAVKYAADNPYDFERATRYFEKALKAAEGTVHELAADAELAKLGKRRIAYSRFDAARRRAADLAGEGDYDAAVEVIAALPRETKEPLAHEVTLEINRIREAGRQRFSELLRSAEWAQHGNDVSKCRASLLELERMGLATEFNRNGARIDNLRAWLGIPPGNTFHIGFEPWEGFEDWIKTAPLEYVSGMPGRAAGLTTEGPANFRVGIRRSDEKPFIPLTSETVVVFALKAKDKPVSVWVEPSGPDIRTRKCWKGSAGTEWEFYGFKVAESGVEPERGTQLPERFGLHLIDFRSEEGPFYVDSVTVFPGGTVEGRISELKRLSQMLAARSTAPSQRAPADNAIEEEAKKRLIGLLDECYSFGQKGDYGSAARLLREAAGQVDFEPVGDELKAAERVVRALEERRGAVRQGGSSLIGKEVVLETLKGQRKGEVKSVDEKGISLVMRQVVGGSRVEMQFAVGWDELAYFEEKKLARSWRARDAHAQIALALIALWRDDCGSAEKALESAGGHPMSGWLKGRIDAARMGEAEAAAVAAWREIAKRASVRQLSKGEAKDLLAELGKFEQEYGSTQLAASKSDEIAAMRSRAGNIYAEWTGLPVDRIVVQRIGEAEVSIANNDTLIISVAQGERNHVVVPFISDCSDFRLKFEYQGPLLEMFMRKPDGWRGAINLICAVNVLVVRFYASEDPNAHQTLQRTNQQDLVSPGWHTVEISAYGTSFAVMLDGKPFFRTDQLPFAGAGDVVLYVWYNKGIPFHIRNVNYSIQDKQDEGGRVVGLLTFTGPDWIRVKCDSDGIERQYVPLENAAGYDANMMNTIKSLPIPNRVNLVWKRAGGKRRIMSVDVSQPPGLAGTDSGIVTVKGPNWLELRLDDGTYERYLVRWIGGPPEQGGGPDSDAMRTMSQLTIGDKASVDWRYGSRKVIYGLQKQP